MVLTDPSDGGSKNPHMRVFVGSSPGGGGLSFFVFVIFVLFWFWFFFWWEGKGGVGGLILAWLLGWWKRVTVVGCGLDSRETQLIALNYREIEWPERKFLHQSFRRTISFGGRSELILCPLFFKPLVHKITNL